jgi:hypothetical protein
MATSCGVCSIGRSQVAIEVNENRTWNVALGVGLATITSVEVPTYVSYDNVGTVKSLQILD